MATGHVTASINILVTQGMQPVVAQPKPATVSVHSIT
jgi:hypothetical protein